MNRAFVDTSGWYAYIRSDDPDHESVAAALKRWEGRLVTSNFVFDELMTLVRSRLGHGLAVRSGRLLRSRGIAEMARASHEDEEEAWTLFGRDSDKAFSFTDCVSFAQMSRLKLQVAITTDSHFSQAGFVVEP